MIASGPSYRIDQVHVLESTHFAWYPSQEVIFQLMGLGKTPGAFEADIAAYRRWLGGLFRESVMMIADGLALELDDVEIHADTARAEDRYEIAAGVIQAGTIAAQRFRWTGISRGEPRIVLGAVHRATAEVAPSRPAPGCAVRIDGRPSLKFELGEDWISNALAGTAMHAVNAVPAVCDAPAGIRTFLDLPLIAGRHAVAR